MDRIVKFDVHPREMPGRNWHLIAVWSELDSDTRIREDDIWISGNVDEFVQDYEAGTRDFEIFSIPDGVVVLVNAMPIAGAVKGSVPHVPERRTVVDGNSGGVDVRVTAGYGPVNGDLEKAVLVRQNPAGKPNVTVEFWAPIAVVDA